MAKKGFLLGMLALALTFGLSMSSCELGIKPDTESNTETPPFIFVNQSSYTLKFEIEPGEGWTPTEFTLLPSNSQIVVTMELVTGISYRYTPGDKVTHNNIKNTLTFFDK